MKKSKIFLIVFFIACTGDLISIVADLNVRFLFKPLIVPALVGFYFMETENRNSTFMRALLFCWAGDFVLMFEGQIYFIVGLVAFLIGHLFYIFSFRQLVWETESTMLPTQRVRYTFPILLAGTGLMVILYPVLGDLRMPVMVYAIVLMLMVNYALFRITRTTKESFIWVFGGAVFFMISDSMLAINKFHTSFFMADFAIMLTYIAAQFMIVRGVLKHE